MQNGDRVNLECEVIHVGPMKSWTPVPKTMETSVCLRLPDGKAYWIDSAHVKAILGPPETTAIRGPKATKFHQPDIRKGAESYQSSDQPRPKSPLASTPPKEKP